ncbi:MAG: alkylhydroperoxidase-related (seleno)protein [Gammaproteobacteria bacterium]|nr:alkylhydroperoxidase-related (seleno)protein [Gammaproteobacteria bacterium]
MSEPVKLTVRNNLSDSHQAAWESFSRPGTWWTAAERRAIVLETRNASSCALCRDRAQALSPERSPEDAGDHEQLGLLAPEVAAIVHRIRTDPGRLSRAWFNAHVEGTLDHHAYVELVGVLTIATIIDVFRAATGQPSLDLAVSDYGDPTRKTTEYVVDDGAFVPIWKPKEEGAANIVRALGLVPEERSRFWDVFGQHYVKRHTREWDAGRAITRPQMELIAARVSAINECFY